MKNDKKKLTIHQIRTIRNTESKRLSRENSKEKYGREVTIFLSEESEILLNKIGREYFGLVIKKDGRKNKINRSAIISRLISYFLYNLENIEKEKREILIQNLLKGNNSKSANQASQNKKEERKVFIRKTDREIRPLDNEIKETNREILPLNNEDKENRGGSLPLNNKARKKKKKNN